MKDYQTQNVLETFEEHFMPNYSRLPLVVDRGEGSFLFSVDGKKYLDFFTGISVNNLGHRPKAVVRAVSEQLEKFFHISNIFYAPIQGQLAKKLCEVTFADKVFFSNSGAEANEAAIKLARKWGNEHKTDSAREIICMKRGFHGRTLATLSATGQDKIREGFEPWVEGFKFVPFGDAAALEAAVTPKTLAVMLEPIQAEGGVYVAPPGYLKAIRQLCDRENILLIFDEIQTGMGRTGKFSFHEWDEVAPDIMTMAKALGGGLPLGACLTSDKIASSLTAGSHGSTFGGNPVACAAGLAMVQEISRPELLAQVNENGKILNEALRKIANQHDFVLEVRGKGMIWGMECDSEVKDLVQGCLDRGLLVTKAGNQTLRLLPPLNITQRDLEDGIEILESVFKDFSRG